MLKSLFLSKQNSIWFEHRNKYGSTIKLPLIWKEAENDFSEYVRDEYLPDNDTSKLWIVMAIFVG